MNTSLERAVRFISAALAENSDDTIVSLVEKASGMFNLTPKEEDQLMRLYAGSGEKKIIIKS
jgi:hypothetical protein